MQFLQRFAENYEPTHVFGFFFGLVALGICLVQTYRYIRFENKMDEPYKKRSSAAE